MDAYHIDLLLGERGRAAKGLFEEAGITFPLLAVAAEGSADKSKLDEIGSPAIFAKVRNTVPPVVEMDVVIVVPSLLDALDRSNPITQAVVAHELGHAFHRHLDAGFACQITKGGMEVFDDLSAEKEADAFAKRLGLGQELHEFLTKASGMLREYKELKPTEKEKILYALEERIKALES